MHHFDPIILLSMMQLDKRPKFIFEKCCERLRVAARLLTL